MEALKVLLPAVTALFGAWFGAQLALTKFKRERAFDRRLDWYERMARSLQRLRSISWEMSTTLRQMSADRYSELADQARLAAHEFDNLVAEREIYAKAKAADAVGQGLLSSFRLQHDMPTREQHGRPVAGFWERQHKLWTETFQVVSAEIREELFPTRTRSIRFPQFRGRSKRNHSVERNS